MQHTCHAPNQEAAMSSSNPTPVFFNETTNYQGVPIYTVYLADEHQLSTFNRHDAEACRDHLIDVCTSGRPAFVKDGEIRVVYSDLTDAKAAIPMAFETLETVYWTVDGWKLPEPEGRWTVIENTPGYLPEDDDPPVFDSYAEAVSYLNERVAEYVDDPDGEFTAEPAASSGNYAAAVIHDHSRQHDLGRWIAVERVEEDSPDITSGDAAQRWQDGRDDHDCLHASDAETALQFIGYYGAPGRGSAWKCATCGLDWTKIGDSFHDPADGPFELQPRDVI
jgi:hypothetical protein